MPDLRQPIKRHGGKWYLAKNIIALMPPRAKNANAPAANDPGWIHYVEAYFGGGAVLLANDPEGISEVVNDIDPQLANFWEVLADRPSLVQMVHMLETTPCGEKSFEKAKWFLENRPINGVPSAEHAAAFFTVNRQSRQALGKDFATLAKTRTRRGMNELPAAWLSAIDGLPEVHARLQRVVILSEEAVKVIRQQDGPRTLFYLDPPYLHDTRTVTDAYDYEMTVRDHALLLETIASIKGRFLLSGYRSELYDAASDKFGWGRVDFEIDNKSGSGKKKQPRTECVWKNF